MDRAMPAHKKRKPYNYIQSKKIWRAREQEKKKSCAKALHACNNWPGRNVATLQLFSTLSRGM
jgi:hypothetical protein